MTIEHRAAGANAQALLHLRSSLMVSGLAWQYAQALKQAECTPALSSTMKQAPDARKTVLLSKALRML